MEASRYADRAWHFELSVMCVWKLLDVQIVPGLVGCV